MVSCAQFLLQQGQRILSIAGLAAFKCRARYNFHGPAPVVGTEPGIDVFATFIAFENDSRGSKPDFLSAIYAEARVILLLCFCWTITQSTAVKKQARIILSSHRAPPRCSKERLYQLVGIAA